MRKIVQTIEVSAKKSQPPNSTFGFCQRLKPKHKKPKEQFLANAKQKLK